TLSRLCVPRAQQTAARLRGAQLPRNGPPAKPQPSESPPTIKLMFVSHHNDVVFTLSLLCPTTPYLIACNLTQRAVTSCSPDDLYLLQPSVMASRVQYSGTDERQKS